MNVLLVSQCNKRALTETRRILDQFAERRGDRSWQTPITQQGLQTLHKMLRKTARKNTAVACHWIRGKDHSELMWIVGDAKRFNAQGATPTNTTQRNVLRSQDENDWHTAEDIQLLAAMAGLLHDIGKANNAFQAKLKSKQPIADAYRHEWVSLRLFEAFVGNSSDEAWLSRLAELSIDSDQSWFNNLQRDGVDQKTRGPFKKLPPLAQVVGWLVVSHHRLPTLRDNEKSNDYDLPHLPKAINAAWCGMRDDLDEKQTAACWEFNKGLPFLSKHWCEHISKLARRMLQRSHLLTTQWFDNPYVVHLSRLALMLADHYYSAENSHSRYGDAKFPLIANTLRDGNNTPNQRLDEHLIGVEVNASRIVRTLPRMAQQLPRIARHKGFRQRSKDADFRWQDKAYDLASSLQVRSEQQGFFGVNMASTGCGKTLANGRIMYGLSDPQHGARFNIALGLRTLTLQTGDAYRDQLGLGDEDLAVLVGGGAIRALHEQQRIEGSAQENAGANAAEQALNRAGSESQADLLPENHYVHFEGSLEDGPLNEWLKNNRDAQKLLNAPILACTIDHLMPATEGIRGGRQIAPMLRLMSSDLVLDEPDDFGMEDLPALTRLVHWAGLLGSRVLLSSATLPPSLVQGLFQAYQAGRSVYQQNRGSQRPVANVCCAWFDEFSTQASDHTSGENYAVAHQTFAEKRQRQLANVAKTEMRRKADIQLLPIATNQKRDAICVALAAHVHQQLHALHQHHSTADPKTGKRVSFGLIRMANINPLIEVAQALYGLGANEDCHIHLCVYHSQHPLLVRSSIEDKLDKLLNRKQPDAIFEDEELRQQLTTHPEKNHIFVVLATAVAEVGRDHDYDWAIVEPSSMRSIIQLAGRVRRHRPGSVDMPNLYLLDTNIRHLASAPGTPAFCRPGFESKYFMLDAHKLSELLTSGQLAVIDASSRICECQPLTPAQNLVDLEHARLRDLMLEKPEGEQPINKPVYWWWNTQANLSGYLQWKQPFRHDPQGRQRYALLLNNDDEIQFCKISPGEKPIPMGNLKHDVTPEAGPNISFWGEPDYELALNTLAERLGMDEVDCAWRFGFIDLPANENNKGWHYHPALGFWRLA